MRYITECSTARWPRDVDASGAAMAGGLSILLLGVAGLEHNAAKNEVAPSWDARSTTDSDVADLVRVGLVTAVIAVGLGVSSSYGSRSAYGCDEARLRFVKETSAYPPQYLQPPPWTTVLPAPPPAPVVR